MPVPGWSKGSGKKGGSKIYRDQQSSEEEELKFDLPTGTIEDVACACFGDVNERQELQSTLLKRSKPEQKLFGYAKKFLDSETRRLAVGLKVREREGPTM